MDGLKLGKCPCENNDSFYIKSMITEEMYYLKDSLRFDFDIVDMVDIEKKICEDDFCVSGVLSEKEIQYLDMIKLQKNRIQWISGRCAVKSALFKQRLNNQNVINLSCIDVLKRDNSAPYIPQYPLLNVSITHSHPLCIGVVSDNKIGIDIESLFEVESSLIKYFFCDNEKKVLEKLNGEEYYKKALVFWTRKEAVSKLVGLGMKLDFKNLDTSGNQVKHSFYDIKLNSFCVEGFCVSIASST